MDLGKNITINFSLRNYSKNKYCNICEIRGEMKISIDSCINTVYLTLKQGLEVRYTVFILESRTQAYFREYLLRINLIKSHMKYLLVLTLVLKQLYIYANKLNIFIGVGV